MPSEFEPVRAVIDADSPTLAAFDYLMAHAAAAGFVRLARTAGVVQAVELQYPDRRLNPFAVQARSRHLNFYLRGPILKERGGLFQAAANRFGPVAANGRGEYRLHLRTTEDVDDLLGFLRREGAWPTHRHAARFATSTLEAVSGEHLLKAARRLAGGDDGHPFGPSTDYDVSFEGVRLPPKAVFGLAATEALGFEVRPENFRGGEGTQCFRVLRENGYLIVGKSEAVQPAALTEEDRTWAEGRPRLVAHLRRERGAGLSAAKRASFRSRHGRLFCERCGLDPVASFGSADGEACIEVHHRATAIGDMMDNHRTKLDDLECLCANCHRVVHWILRSDPAVSPTDAAESTSPRPNTPHV